MLRRVLLVAIAILPAVLHATGGRLYFRNDTTGVEAPGGVCVLPGDQVSIRFSYHDSVSWGTLQLALQLDGNNLIPTIQASQWVGSIHSAMPPGQYYTSIAYGPGVLYEDATMPNDSTKPIVSPNAGYALYQVVYSNPQSKNIDVTLFQFQVASSIQGQELHWINEGITTQNGISTRLIVQGQGTQLVTDNYVRVEARHATGLIDFTHASQAFDRPSSVTMRITSSGGGAQEQNVPLDQNGRFDILLRPGISEISVKYTNWLRRTVQIDASQGDVSGIVLKLLNGDAFVDDAVDVRDLNMVLTYFGQPGAPYSDLTRDGATDISDLNIVLANFRLVSDP